MADFGIFVRGGLNNVYTSPAGFVTIVKDIAIISFAAPETVLMYLLHPGPSTAPFLAHAVALLASDDNVGRFIVLEPGDGVDVQVSGAGACNVQGSMSGAVLPSP